MPKTPRRPKSPSVAVAVVAPRPRWKLHAQPKRKPWKWLKCLMPLKLPLSPKRLKSLKLPLSPKRLKSLKLRL